VEGKNLSSQLEEAYFSSIKKLNDGEIVKGRIVEVRPKEVIIDIGYKSEGVVPRDEFSLQDTPSVGSEVEVLVEKVEDEEGRLVISYERAKKSLGWRKLITEYKEGDLVEGVVNRKVKGGFMVEVFGVEGFLPGSLSTFRYLPDEEVLGKKFLFQIIKLSRLKQNFIVSRRDALRLEKEIQKRKIWDSLKVGKVVKGRVKSITDFGAFVDIGGIDGLLHIADMSWRKVNNPQEVVAVGDEVEVMILNIDKQSQRLSLGMKQLTPDPWANIEERFPQGSVVKGKIVNIQPYGIFVELDKGIEGLVHISELSWSKAKVDPFSYYAIGDMVEVKVVNVDIPNRKISLSIKRLEKDPWQEIPQILEKGAKVKGKVIGFIQNAAFVELPPGVEGIIYTQDLSWTKRINRPQEVLKRNHTYEFKVLEIDNNNRRVILGLKQLREDPWPRIVKSYPVGKVVEGEVVKITDFGIFVRLEEELEGLIFGDEIEPELKENIKVGDKIKAEIIKVDTENRKIGLSAKIDESQERSS